MFASSCRDAATAAVPAAWEFVHEPEPVPRPHLAHATGHVFRLPDDDGFLLPDSQVVANTFAVGLQ